VWAVEEAIDAVIWKPEYLFGEHGSGTRISGI